MKPTILYMIHYHEEDAPSGVVQEWFTTWAKAMRRLRQLGLADSETIHIIEVPRTRVAMVEWLNIYAKVG